jgi:hypothetical protein
MCPPAEGRQDIRDDQDGAVTSPILEPRIFTDSTGDTERAVVPAEQQPHPGHPGYPSHPGTDEKEQKTIKKYNLKMSIIEPQQLSTYITQLIIFIIFKDRSLTLWTKAPSPFLRVAL